MSIYSDLREQVDRVLRELHKRDDHISRAEKALARAMRCNEDTAKTYNRLASESVDPMEKVDFASRALGVLDANINIKRFLEDLNNERYEDDL